MCYNPCLASKKILFKIFIFLKNNQKEFYGDTATSTCLACMYQCTTCTSSSTCATCDGVTFNYKSANLDCWCVSGYFNKTLQ